MDHMTGYVLLHHELTRAMRERKRYEWSLDAPEETKAEGRGILARLLRGLRRPSIEAAASCRDLSPAPARHCR